MWYLLSNLTVVTIQLKNESNKQKHNSSDIHT